MAKSWYLMARPLFNSGYEKDEFENYAKDGFSEFLESFISSYIEIYDQNFILLQSLKAIIQNVTADAESSSFIRQILIPIGNLKTGYYVKYNGSFWLIKDIVDNNEVYEKAIMFFCNYKINFISDVSSEIVSYPVHMKNATQYNSGETAREQETIGSSKFLMFIPYNKETIKIDHGKRFLIDKNHDNPTAFEITQVDTISHNFDDDFAVIRWTLVESQFNTKTDNKELMIADYYKSENDNESWF